MSISIDEGGGRRRKGVDGDLNLVPYIDLLTCMVAFLLITAVWSQLARLEVQQKGQGQAGADVGDATKLAVLVHEDGFGLVLNGDQRALPKLGAGYDYERLQAELTALKQQHADKTDVQVMSVDAIPFEILVRTMDAALSAGFPDISLLDAGASAP